MSAVHISATSHLIKRQIWTWPFVWLRFYVLSGHTDAEQRPAHFASRLQSHHRPVCLCGGNFRVKVRTRSSFLFFFFFRENRTGSLAFEKLESYVSHRSGGHIYTYLERRDIACFIRYPCYCKLRNCVAQYSEHIQRLESCTNPNH